MLGLERMQREALIEKLIRSYHLNVEERKGLSPQLRRSEIQAVIAKAVESKGFFPRQHADGYQGELRALITTATGYDVIWTTEVSLNRYAVVSRNSYSNLKEAVTDYARQEYKSSIDGIPVLDA